MKKGRIWLAVSLMLALLASWLVYSGRRPAASAPRPRQEADSDTNVASQNRQRYSEPRSQREPLAGIRAATQTEIDGRMREMTNIGMLWRSPLRYYGKVI